MGETTKYERVIKLLFALHKAEMNCGIQLVSEISDINLISLRMEYLNPAFIQIMKKHKFEICSCACFNLKDLIVVQLEILD